MDWLHLNIIVRFSSSRCLHKNRLISVNIPELDEGNCSVPVEYGAGWCSRRAPKVQLAELSGGQVGFGPKLLLMGLYWKPLAWLHELKSA